MSKKRVIIFSILIVMLLSQVLAACGPKKIYYDNENNALVLSSSDLDGVFNPFFATSGADMSVIAMTQLSMFSADKEGRITYGKDENCIVLDYTMQEPAAGTKEGDAGFESTYKFLLKNDIKFSDGTLLTSADVLFNFYVYLDPVYTGSTTMYSTEIKGLTEYRNQTYDPAEYEQAEINFPIKGKERITRLINWADSSSTTLESLTEEMSEDLDTVKDFFLEELNSDWNAAAGTLADYEKDYPEINNTWRAFLVMQGYITLVNDKIKGKYIEWDGLKDFCNGLTDEQAKEKCINTIYNSEIETEDIDTLKESISVILNYRSSGVLAEEYFIAHEKSKYFEQVKENNKDGGLVVKSISGITVDDSVKSFNGQTYTDDHSLLTIKINGVDPKAIYNFSISIAPMKYYAGEYADLYNGVDHFGVDCGNIDFMFKTVRAQDVPVGAGPYQASSEHNATGNISKNAFFSGNVVYYLRNEYFHLGKPVIKKVRYKVITKAQLLDSASLGDVHFIDPDAKASNITKVNNDSKLKAVTVENLGYGYIGINAKYVPDIKVRRAIMHAMNTALAMEYYTNDMASIIHRPMSKVSWAYPKNATSAYPFDTTGASSWNLLKESYWKNDSGILTDGNSTLKYTFTIAGDSDDHPMYATMAKAKEILENIGFSITVTKDPNALRKLSSGLLTVWAAAWGSTIDPDLYQVYHMDSTASSVLNWGYKEILSGNNSKYNTGRTGTNEVGMVEELSALIDEGRRYLDPNDRVGFYHDALDKIMELAIELPTYQRNNMFVYNKDVIDESTLTPASELSPYTGPTSRIWEISLVTKK